VVQRPQHGNAGYHDNAALLGGRDQKFHCDLPMLALGFGRRQRKDINAGIAEGSEFATIASRDWIKKMAGPTCLPAERAWQITSPDFKTKVPPAACRQRLKVGDVHAGPPNMLIGLGEC
jgi:hypothetical protein